ncbi:Septin-8-B [Bagarius yarrelli]|uniref:Septin-8-B n=1 Tax=Bagarius yarrelli TaxID=175774 RepID=A0A556V9X3_BAGYA|nr:Septin-8-B [Bagarius yarrelli]
MAAVDVDLYPTEEKRTLTLGGHVGFDSLPDQLVSKSVSQGFYFNILCVGETGIGKSTLMNTLFNTSFEKDETGHYENGVYLRPRMYELKESNVELKLTIVDTVGFGDQVNKEESHKPITDYIDAQFEDFLQEELKIKRSLFNYRDSRIHVCLYFINPTGHSLRSLDLVTMKMLDSKVNIIPIIAKADSISKSELQKFKIKIMSELVSNGVQIYQFPTDDEAVAELNSSMNAQLPFSVVGSGEEVKVGNKLVRARQYPWGVVQVENESHCDFVKLREMLIRVNMEDLREQTHTRHYELYRRCKLEQMGFKDTEADLQPFSLQETYVAKRREFIAELQRMEEDMRQMFVVKVKETEAELKERERELHERFERVKRIHQEEKKILEEKRRELEEEMNSFNRRKMAAETMQALSLQTAKDKKSSAGCCSMIDTVSGAEALPFAVQLKTLLELEVRCQPKLSGLRVLESAHDNGMRMTTKMRDFEVKDLLSLTRFFGFSAETFSLAVSLLDRFLSVMKIQPKHLSCVGLCCFYIAVKTAEEEKNIPLATDLIRISQNRFTVSDMMRMEKIILEKLYWKVKGPTALNFLRLFHNYSLEKVDADRSILHLERLESQLKACHCSFAFTKLRPSLVALALLAREVEEQHESEAVGSLREAVKNLQCQLTIKDGDLVCVRELISKCLAEYSATKSWKPNSQRLRWIISGRTARQLKHSYYKIAHMPTIPESAS